MGSLALSFAVGGCGSSDDGAAVPVVAAYQTRDSAGVAIVESDRPAWSNDETWRVEPTPQLVIGGNAADPDQQLWGVRHTTKLPDGSIAIANAGANELRVYDAAGRLVRTSGGTGAGPGEFRMMVAVFHAPGDSLAVADIQNGRISILDSDGTFSRSVPLTDGSLLTAEARFTDGAFLTMTSAFVLSAEGPARHDWVMRQIARLEPDGTMSPIDSIPWLEVTVASYPLSNGGSSIGQRPRMFGHTVTVVADSLGWLEADNSAAELRFRAPTGELQRIARWEAARREVTSEDVGRYREDRVARYDDAVLRRRWTDALGALPGPPDVMPAFGTTVLMDAGRHVWLAEYRPSYEEDADDFQVFDATGVWLGAVTMPAGLRPWEIGDDYVLGVVRDEMQVESVVLHRLVKP
ncbi:MAG: hypothetical protein PVJ80_11795 [Gemmatimonadota bacterium]